MTNKKTTKRALFASVLSLLLCVSMLIGSTFAWFTDTASTGVNKIQAGNLDVALEMYDEATQTWVPAEGKTLDFKKAADAPADEKILWEPGCTYELPQLRVINNGDLYLKYMISITGIEGDAKLNEAIEWTYGDDVTELGKDYKTLAPKAYSETITIKGQMKEEAGNEYQGLSIDGISITVYATQVEAEYDSFNDTYDENAAYPQNWAEVADTSFYTEGATAVEINTPAQVAGLAQLVSEGDDMSGVTITLGTNVNLAGIAFTPIGEKEKNKPFAGTFDGNGKTISGLKISANDLAEGEDYAALFSAVSGTVKNLTVDGTVESATAAGIVGVLLDGGKVENCVSNVNVIGSSKAGGIVGMINNADGKGSVVGCVNNGTISGKNVGGIVGLAHRGTTFTNCVNNGTVNGTDYVGGILGYGQGTGDGTTTFTKCENRGTVTGAEVAGAMAGFINGEATVNEDCELGGMAAIGLHQIP